MRTFKHYLFSICCGIALLFSSSAMAQPIDCGGSGDRDVTIQGTQICGVTSQSQAEAKMGKRIANNGDTYGVSCAGCDLPTDKGCDLKFFNFPNGISSSNAGHGCYNFPAQTVTVSFTCTWCVGKETIAIEGVLNDYGVFEPLVADQGPDVVSDDNSLKLLYPNPATSEIELEINVADNETKVEIVITDLTGKVVFTQDIGKQPSGLTLVYSDITDLPQGYFHVSVYFNDQLKGALPLVVTR